MELGNLFTCFVSFDHKNSNHNTNIRYQSILHYITDYNHILQVFLHTLKIGQVKHGFELHYSRPASHSEHQANGFRKYKNSKINSLFQRSIASTMRKKAESSKNPKSVFSPSKPQRAPSKRRQKVQEFQNHPSCLASSRRAKS